MSSTFLHAMHIEFIRRALWRPRSRAVVMVGAGLSRNAEASNSAAPPFPLWQEFTERLRKDLYGNPKAENSPEVLRLAEEYELAAGRTALDDLLLEMIPDAQYQPGPLHDLLLSLPWADIFTTNYDTLLERARAKVHDFKYDLVQTPADIARAERPRIVKLHGSFPSHRPFIFTAEDYRTYPTRFAPYVNMVQQAIMENVFCMIGFSGSDPNFIQWTGWVRDHLGTSAPKIYLCDVLDLTPAKERLYQSLRVIPVDLGPLVPASKWTTPMRYRKALEWLLLSLRNGRPQDTSKWPTVLKPATSSDRDHAESPTPLEPPETPHQTQPIVTHLLPDQHLSQNDLQQLTASWRNERLAYPGWVVIPERNRRDLYNATSDWFDERPGRQLSTLMRELPVIQQAEQLYELLWRFRRALSPLPSWLVRDLNQLLERLNPKPDLIDLQSISITPETPQGNTDKVTEIWVECAFSILNDAWQEQNKEQHTLWMKRLEKVVKLKSDWLARWHYAQCWHHLLNLDEQSVREALKQWPENWGLPFWEAKRASIFAELGDAEAALRHAKKALERLRQGMSSAVADTTSYSEEAWLIELIHSVSMARGDPGIDLQDGLPLRIRHPFSAQYDPHEDLRLRAQAVRPRKNAFKESTEYNFDPSSKSTTYGFALSFSPDEWIFVQSLHDGVCPIRCGYYVPSLDGMAETVHRLWRHQPRLALALAIRVGAFNKLEKILSRVDVSVMDPVAARSIFDWLSSSFLNAMESRPSPSRTGGDNIEGFGRRLLEGLPLVLSRLTIHLTSSQLEHAFDIALKVHAYEPFRHPALHRKVVGQLFRRVLFSATVDQIYAWLPKMLELPLRSEQVIDAEKAFFYAEPLVDIPWQSNWRRPTDRERATWAESAMRLINILQGGVPEQRADASLRIAILLRIGGLGDDQGKKAMEALWSQTDGNGFPSHVGFAPVLLLAFPSERTPGENRAAVTRHMLAMDPALIEVYLDMFANGTVCPWHSDEERKVRIEWTPREAEALLLKALDWWTVKSPNFNRGGISASNLKKTISKLIRHLGVDVLPYLGDRAQAHRESILRLVSELGSMAHSTLLALPALMIFDPKRDADTAVLLRRAIYGASESDVEQGLVALVAWFGLARTGKVPSPPCHLVDDWVAGIIARRQPGLLNAVDILVRFVRIFGDQLQERHLRQLNEGLMFFLSETRPQGAGGSNDELSLVDEERIALRHYASRLAAQLQVEYERRGIDVPSVIQQWRNAATIDPLPEVRQAWTPLTSPQIE